MLETALSHLKLMYSLLTVLSEDVCWGIRISKCLDKEFLQHAFFRHVYYRYLFFDRVRYKEQIVRVIKYPSFS